MKERQIDRKKDREKEKRERKEEREREEVGKTDRIFILCKFA